MFILSFGYRQGNSFDENYYSQVHTKAVRNVLSNFNGSRLELRKTISENVEASNWPYQFTASLYFPSEEALQQFMEHPEVPNLQEDVRNFYSGKPDVWIEKTI